MSTEGALDRLIVMHHPSSHLSELCPRVLAAVTSLILFRMFYILFDFYWKLAREMDWKAEKGGSRWC
jgi:hypothetical protein